MACTKFDKTIDTGKYITITFPAREGGKLFIRLTKTFGPLFSSIKMDDVMSSEINLAMFIEKLDDDGVIGLIMDLLRYTKRNGTDITEEVFDEDFSGKYEELLSVVLWIIQVNNFFGKGDRIGKLTTAKTNTESPSESVTN